MKYRLIIIVILNILLSSAVFSQKLGNIWYFGKYCGLTFNTADGRPRALTENRLQIWEGCATVSNEAGDIEFYTDGSNVLTKNHDWMWINGVYRQYYLNGCSSSSQSAIILPFSDDSLKYYIFTTECFENKLRSRGVNYSVVNMRDNGGFGNIFPYNINIALSSLEKITATQHSNGKSYWVITHSYDTDEFYSFLVDDSGIQSPVISKVPPIIGDVKAAGDQGYLKASSDGKRLAAAYTQLSNIYLYDFDNTSGRVSNPNKLFNPDEEQSFYGVEFSPDAGKLYVSFFGFEKGIYQFDLSSNDITAIRNSAKLILDEKGFPPGALQIGPDGRIYVAKDISPYLHVIEYPNRLYPACDLRTEAVYLDIDNTGRQCHLGLPNAMPSIFYVHVTARATIPACEGDTVFLNAVVDASSEGYSVFWRGPLGFTSYSKDTSMINVSKNASGWYYVEVTLNDRTVIDSVYVEVSDSPFTEIIPSSATNFCEGDSVELRANPYNPSLFYSWSTGEINESIIVKKTGRYYLRVKNSGNCEYLDSIDINVVNKPAVSIIAHGDVDFCDGDSVILEIQPFDADVDYYWSSGEKTKFITVKTSGSYKVVAENGTGCRDSAVITVSVLPLPDAVIQEGDNVSICAGDSVILNALPNGQTYKWSTGSTAQSITVSQPGIYFVVVENANNCKDTAYCTVSEFPLIPAEIIGNTSICKGDSTLLSLTNKFVSYLWSTGNTTESIYAKENGFVYVWTVDSNGCKSKDSIYIDVYEISVNADELKSIEFGRVLIDKDSTLTINIMNEDAYDFTIERIYFKNAAAFNHLNTLPAVVRSGEVYPVNIKFSPENIIDYKDSIIIQINSPCNLRLAGFVRGSGIVELFVIIPDTTGKIGDKGFCIPVYSYLNTQREIQDISDWLLTVSHDAQLFLPEQFPTPPIINGRREVTMKGASQVSNNLGVLADYCGAVMLGEKDFTTIDVLDMQYDNPNVIVKTFNGSLTVNGICVKNLSRLLPLKRTSITITPTPVNDKININYYLNESGRLTIKLLNYSTKEVRQLYQDNSARRGNSTRTFDMQNLNSGVYLLIFQINSNVIAEKIIIIR